MRVPLELAAGSHIVTVGDRGHKSWSKEVRLERGQAVQLRPTLERTGQRKVSYVVGGSSLIALGVGGLYFAAAASSNSDLQTLEAERKSTGLDTAQFADYRRASTSATPSELVASHSWTPVASSRSPPVCSTWSIHPVLKPTRRAEPQRSRRRASRLWPLSRTFRRRQPALHCAGDSDRLRALCRPRHPIHPHSLSPSINSGVGSRRTETAS